MYQSNSIIYSIGLFALTFHLMSAVFPFRQCLEHRLGFHNRNAAAPNCFFVSIMTSLSRGTGFLELQQTACLFLQKAAGALNTSFLLSLIS